MSKNWIRLVIRGSLSKGTCFLDWRKGKIEKLPSISSEFS
jgi:hypothetical protein